MNKYSKRKSNLYSPSAKEPFRISRSKIDLFLECPRCFYLDRRLGLGRPSMPGWTLNTAVDQLLKNEFDLLRKQKQPHDLMKKYNINAIPYDHPELDKWRDNFTGAQFHHQQTNLIITGAIDDVWQNPAGKLLIVDYKTTSTEKEISLDDEYKKSYKKQMEVYQWIFSKMGFDVSETGYFIFANAGKTKPKFDGILEFKLSIIPYIGDTSWVEPTIFAIKDCLEPDKIPPSNNECEYCAYRELIKREE